MATRVRRFVKTGNNIKRLRREGDTEVFTVLASLRQQEKLGNAGWGPSGNRRQGWPQCIVLSRKPQGGQVGMHGYLASVDLEWLDEQVLALAIDHWVITTYSPGWEPSQTLLGEIDKGLGRA